MNNLRKLIFFFCAINFTITYVRTDWLVKCGPCKCKWNSGKRTADCKNTLISKVPTDLSAEVQVLDLSSNYIPEIHNGEFISAQLRNLHKLFMRNCTLKLVSRESLKGLEILIELDLSYNLIKSLPRGTFSNLVKLRAVMLNNNNIEKLDDGLFRNLKFLHKIELMNNFIVKIEPKAFTNLPLLTQIYLDGNKLTVLKREIFMDLDKLTSLSLKLNPWNCTCELKSFRDFAFQQKLYTPPTDCYYPVNLRGTLWSDVSTNAFACKPEILYPLPAAASTSINAINENVTISCRIHSSPNSIIRWTYNKHSFTNYPKRIFIKNISETNEQDAMELLTSELTIIGVKKSDEGTYTCIAQNVAGKTEKEILLSVQKKMNENQFLSNNLLFILCLMAVGLLVASLIIMAITCCYCRKFKKLAKQDLDNKKQFEVIKLNAINSTANGGATAITATTTATTSSPDFEIPKQQQNNHHPHSNQQQKIDHNEQQLHHQHQMHNNHQQVLQQSSLTAAATAAADFSHVEKSDIIGNDTHEIKCVLLGDKFTSDSSSKDTTTSNILLSPLRHQFIYEQHDTRLPPDLLPYGPQSISLQNSSAIILENGQYVSSAYDEEPIFYKDNTSNCSKDLRIYQDCSSNYGVQQIQPSHQEQLYQKPIIHSQQQLLQQSHQHSSSRLALAENPCKPRQSIVRTSPSFSFLSTGYQQQNNFL